MKLAEFVFINVGENAGFELIMQTGEMQRIFRVYKFTREGDATRFMANNNMYPGDECVTFEHYNIVICYVGPLDLCKVYDVEPFPGHKVDQTTKELFTDIKNFYETNRIKGNETRLKKYRKEIYG